MTDWLDDSWWDPLLDSGLDTAIEAAWLQHLHVPPVDSFSPGALVASGATSKAALDAALESGELRTYRSGHKVVILRSDFVSFARRAARVRSASIWACRSATADDTLGQLIVTGKRSVPKI
jgi:hypothetical protein